jgi:rod shape determining protein RodA
MGSYKSRWYKDLDLFLIFVVLAVCVASLVAISSATHSLEGGSRGYVTKQLIFIIIGIVAMITLIRTDYRMLIRHIEIPYWIVIGLLCLVFAFPESHGAQAWIPLGAVSLQPSEFFKVVFLLMMAKYLANEEEDENGHRKDPLRNYFFLIAYGLLGIGLIVIEPDLGQTMILMALIGTALFVHLPSRAFWISMGIGTVAVAIFTSVVFMYPKETLHTLKEWQNKGILQEHQYKRFETFLDPERDLAGQGYQVYQAKVAIGSGQLFGKGLYQGSQTQGNWVPEQQTDFIFTVIGEELGFVGAVAIIFLYFLMFYRIIMNGLRAGDRTGMYICAMVAGMFTFQLFENIGMSLQLMPMTGVTLPFISYGGSSVLSNFMLIGIVLNVGFRRRKLSFRNS